MDIEAWLRGLGLGQYVATFRDFAVDADILPDLSDADLEKLGLPLGHRKRLLKAIAGLDVASAAPASTVSMSTTGAAADAERRNIAVLFCDLVGSTGVAARLDAEEWRDIENAYLDAASKAVTDFGGRVAKKLGDGLMALFGYPTAQENDAERAARAALAIQRDLAKLNAANADAGRPRLAVRIGIASGLVVVDAAGEIFGDAPNIAARVQAVAEPGSVLTTAAMQCQLAGLFVVEDLGAHELKGVAGPMALYRLVRQSGAGRRLAARALTPMVGREDEMAALARRWALARRGEGQLLLIVGEPGLGKSRLLEEFRRTLSGTPHTWVEWNCSQLLQNTALHPVVEWGRQRFSADDSPERRLADLEATLTLLNLDPSEHLPLLAPLVDIPLPSERALEGLSPAEFRRKQLGALMAWVMAGARAQPVVLACEDLHWSDPTTLELLRGLAERGGDAPLLILATARPEFRSSWSIRAHHGALGLAPLDAEEVKRMVGQIAARHALSRQTIDGVAARAGGVPLFVEEVTRLLLERHDTGDIQAIPPTLQQSLAARLDRLGPAREIAQVAAVIGRAFSYALLRAVACAGDAELCEGLERLTEAGLIHVHGQPPDADYRFKHALIRDAAYEGLLKSRRQALHARIAENLRDRFPERAEAEPEFLAGHFTQGGLLEPAIDAWTKAGEQAARRSAITEAVAHFEKAINIADALPDRRERRLDRLRLQVAYGNVLIPARGHGAVETTAAFVRARELITENTELSETFSIYYGLWTGHFVRGELEPMKTTAAELLLATEAGSESAAAGIAHRMSGVTYWSAGEFSLARTFLDRALTMIGPEIDKVSMLAFGQEPGVSVLAYLSLTNWPLGNVARAIARADEAVERATVSGHVATIAYSVWHRLLLDLMQRRDDLAIDGAKALIEISEKYELRQWRIAGIFFDGWTRWRRDSQVDGIEAMKRGVALVREQSAHNTSPIYAILHAEALCEHGQIALALAAIDETAAEIEHTGCRWIEAVLYRVRGEILLKMGAPHVSAAEAALARALHIAHAQQARSFELCAAMSLARLYRDRGQSVQARDILAPVYGWFTEGFDTPDLTQAKALLDQLA